MINFQHNSDTNHNFLPSQIQNKQIKQHSIALKFIDLFAGIGGLRLGFARKIGK